MTTAATEADVIDADTHDESTALVPHGPGLRMLGGLALHDAAETQRQLDAYAASRKQFIDWVYANLTAGVDYMLIHRSIGPRGNKRDCPKKADRTSPACADCGGKATLCKPGAEKMCGLLQLRPRFARDRDTWEMLGGPETPGLVAVLCELIGPSGDVVAEGRGARKSDTDYGDVNKTIKMAQKSAQTDAVLRCAGLSEIFTQDLEDMGTPRDDGDDRPRFTPPRRASERGQQSPPPAEREPGSDDGDDDAIAQQLGASIAGAESAKQEQARHAALPDVPMDPLPEDAISGPKAKRAYALLHEAIRTQGVPEKTPRYQVIFVAAKDSLKRWLYREHQRTHLEHCPWKAYAAMCEAIPAAVSTAIARTPEGHARFVRRGRR